MESRTERIGRNEALFRQVNERLKEVGASFSLVSETADFVCECGDLSCTDQIRLSLADYERIREKPTWFALVPGHEIPDVERVVERQESWNVVEKLPGAPARVAEREDPRS
jgi:hypothetical protein